MEQYPDQSYFVTLTYADEHLPLSPCGVPTVKKADLQKFHMDLRRRFQQGFYFDFALGKPYRIPLPSTTRFRFYCTSEYGPEGNRPHYHGFYTALPEDADLVSNLFRQIWGKGFTYVELAESEKAAAYVAKYLINDSLVPHIKGAEKPFSLMSQGLGKSYLDNETLVEWHRSDPLGRNYLPHQGGRQILPRYLREKIFDDAMKADILEASLDREDAENAAIARMSPQAEDAFWAMKRQAEQENLRQAEWRFRKNGKIK